MDYPSNSQINRNKETIDDQNKEEKKIEKVITGTAKHKKKSGFSKFFSNFMSEDIKDIKTFIFADVVMPTIKKTILDVVDMALYGAKTSRNKRYDSGNTVSYRNYYDEPRRPIAKVATAYEYEEVILETRGEAEEVLDQLDAIIDRYQIASVSDLYDLVGIAKNYTDNKYGWTNISKAEVIRTRDGYVLKLPRPVPIK